MTRKKRFEHLSLNSECMQKLNAVYDSFLKDLTKTENELLDIHNNGTIARGDTEWGFDNMQELALELNTPYSHLFCWRNVFVQKQYKLALNIRDFNGSYLEIETHTDSRTSSIEFANAVDEIITKYAISTKPEPVIFIGHGRAITWKDLKEHLKDHHGYQVETFESSPRAGFHVTTVLERMAKNNTIAFLIMAKEDEMADGKFRARQNVFHEIGLFQGHLGMDRAIILKEEGTEDFSNIDGILQIRYSNGNIRETFGEVVATIKREM